jgi:hypothetical protein
MEATELRAWLESLAGIIGAVAAIFVAWLGLRSQRKSHKEALAIQAHGHQEALEQQARTHRETLHQERLLALDSRLWDRRSDLYIRALRELAPYMRSHHEPSPELPEMDSIQNITDEITVFASPAVRAKWERFVFDMPSLTYEDQNELWFELADLIREELGASSLSAHRLEPSGN